MNQDWKGRNKPSYHTLVEQSVCNQAPHGLALAFWGKRLIEETRYCQKMKNGPQFWCKASGLLPVGHIKTNIRGGTAGAAGMTHPPDIATQTAGKLPRSTHL